MSTIRNKSDLNNEFTIIKDVNISLFFQKNPWKLLYLLVNQTPDQLHQAEPAEYFKQEFHEFPIQVDENGQKDSCSPKWRLLTNLNDNQWAAGRWCPVVTREA